MRNSQTIFVLALLVVVRVRSDDNNDTTECKFWHQLAHNLTTASQLPNSQLILSCNSTCSELTCSGHMEQPLNLDFCFGNRLNHCDQPVTMDYYLDVPSLNISLLGSVAHNDSLEVPGPSLLGGKGTIVILVEMVRVNSSHILFGISGQVKVLIAGIYLFPYKEQVFPPTYIDVPPCSDHNEQKIPFKAPPVCKPPSPPLSTPKSPGSTIASSVVKSKTYNKTCEFGLDQCSQHEMCVAQTKLSKGGVCQCELNATLDKTTGYCQPIMPATTRLPKPPATTRLPTQKPPSTQQPVTQKPSGVSNSSPSPKPSVTEAHGSKTKKGGINMTGVIIGAVFGALLLIVVAVSVIIFIGRRRRQADYRGRHQLLTDQDDDDTNVVI